ncbi:uncharacterized protein LOC132548453 [Ylistrum balloti]|uniref:uncharacterized protein LOC132548453 n=1 Tax=Ylistrum balloti TaxID=509963 RepID=UPI00290586D8|nr:uncharacterized protein LOC132548453 [Ylistrum balloti]
MVYTKTVAKVILVCALFGCLACGRSVEGKLKRLRRQAGDVKTAEYLARLALERRPMGCTIVGCGLIDVVQSGKKRDGRTLPSYQGPIDDETRAKMITMLLTGGAQTRRK